MAASAARRLTVALTVLAILAVGCSSSSGSDGAPTTSAAPGGTASSTTATGDPSDRTCDQGATIDPVQAERVTDPELDHDWTITSFDDTRIRGPLVPRRQRHRR